MSRKFRLGVIFTHPTQHHSPLWQRLGEDPEIDITVMYLSAENTKSGQLDTELNSKEPWDVDLTGGYKNIFLKDIGGKVAPAVHGKLFNPDLIKWISPKNFDVVYVSSFVTYSHRLAFFLCKQRRIPIISQNDATIMSETGYFGQVNRSLRSMLYPYLFSLTDYWLATGNHNEIYLRDYGVAPEKIHPAPYPFDRRRFEITISAQPEEIKKIRRTYAPNNDTVLYGFTAKYIKRKEPFNFIEAIRKAHQKNPNIKGVLIGGGELSNQINDRIGKPNGELENIGFVNQKKLPLYYAAMDVFVCPSSIDSHPLVVSEAMAAGCPVILSDRCGNWGYSDVLQHRYNGLVYPCDDTDRLAESMLILADRETRKLYSEHAKEVVATQDLEKTVKTMKTVIEKIKKSKHGA